MGRCGTRPRNNSALDMLDAQYTFVQVLDAQRQVSRGRSSLVTKIEAEYFAMIAMM